MSTEFYTTRKLLYVEFRNAPLPEGLTWWLRNDLSPQLVIRGAGAYVHAYPGRERFEDTDGTVFEMFGGNRGPEGYDLLQRLAKQHDVTFYSQYSDVLVSRDRISLKYEDAPEVWDAAYKAARTWWHA